MTAPTRDHSRLPPLLHPSCAPPPALHPHAGCRDYAPLLAVSAALRFWREAGPEAVRSYQAATLREALATLAAAWGPGGGGTMLVPPPLHAPCMALVRLPGGAAPPGRPADSADAKYIQASLV